MRSLTPEQLDALAKSNVMRRMFVWIEALDLFGQPDPVGFWDDAGNVVVDTRTYHGNVLFQIATLSAKADLSIPGLQIVASQVAPEAINLVRGPMIEQRPITVDMGIFDADTHALIPPLIPYFRGFVDDCVVNTPRKGEAGSITIICESAARALTVRRTETRSSASLRIRNPNDKFYDATGTMGQQPIYFGRSGPQ